MNLIQKFPLWLGHSAQHGLSRIRRRGRCMSSTNNLQQIFSRDTEYVSTLCDESTGALIPPLHMSTTFERDAQGELSRGYMYSRLGNPTRNHFEEVFTKLERGGAESFAFSSGMQAATALLMASPGAHVVLPDDLYHGVSMCLFHVNN